MGCLITKQINKVCETQVAGIKLMAAANWSETVKVTKNSDGVVTGITLPTGQKFYKVNGDSGAGYFNCNLNQGGNADSKSLMHEVGFLINRLDKDIISEYKSWVLGKIIVAVQDKNNDVYLLGLDNGMSATAFNYASGAGATDASGITATFEGIQPNAMVKVLSWDLISAKM